MAQHPQLRVQRGQVRGVRDQALQARALGAAGGIVHARAQAPVQHLPAEDAGLGRQLVLERRQQQVVPGLGIDAGAVEAILLVQTPDILGRKEVIRRRRGRWRQCGDGGTPEMLQVVERRQGQS